MKLDEITAQVRFMGRRRIETEEDLHRTVQEISQRIELLTEERRLLRNEIRRVGSHDRAGELKEEVAQKTSQLELLRKELKLCRQIADRSKLMSANLAQISQ